MKKTFPLILALLLSVNISAKQVSKQDAKQLARNFFWEKSGRAFNEIVFEKETVQFKDAIPVYYVFGLNKGFIIISADDAVFPVLGYSFNGDFQTEDLPDNIKLWMGSYADQIDYAIQNGNKAKKSVAGVWAKYLSKSFSPEKEIKEVRPLLYTNWSQGCYYNSEFPETENENLCYHAYTGCVATAMAEIMKFHNYPKSGTGSHGYESSYGWLEVDFENTFYDWANMKYNLQDENPPVAELIYHCAVSINTQFVPGGSGAYDIDVRDALVDYFGYEEGAQFIWRDSYFGDWGGMLRDELNNGRPVLYGAVAQVKDYFGHTLVCDGYQDSTFFHFNWGWDGAYNGYYYLDSLTANSYEFNLFHDVIIGIWPDIGDSYIIQAPENISASIELNTVELLWDEATEGTLEKLGYNVFRDGQIVNEAIVTDTFYVDMDVPSGEHNYKISTVYIGDEALSENSVFVQGVGIAEQGSREFPFVVSPNPATDYLVISGKSGTDKISAVKLLDLSGKEIKQWDIGFQPAPIQLKLPEVEGMFLLQIINGRESYSSKLIIGK
ncbi:MAG: T9SS type A sorting domain-containing protein [Chlorobi bacterium]|nr:T9SS type A sorting domain-containing protein [Chlorobiota bacterium]